MHLLKHLYTFDAQSRNESNFTKEVVRLCKERGAVVETDKMGNVYCTKGQSDTYPCVVAHLDEVHDKRGKNFVVFSDGNIICGYDDFAKNKRHGIGADDKNGIWVALKCLEQFEAIKCAFFVCEEIGCVGSGSANMAFFGDCRFVLQCDRRNDSDLIVSVCGVQLCSKRFLKDIGYKDHGYAKTTGLLTDVYTLKRRGLKVSCVNLSCGYYNPHTSTEYTNFDHLLKCLKFVTHIVSSCTDVYVHDKRSEPKKVVQMRPSYSFDPFFGSSIEDFIKKEKVKTVFDPWEYDELSEIINEIVESDPDYTDEQIHEELELIYGSYTKKYADEIIKDAREFYSTAS